MQSFWVRGNMQPPLCDGVKARIPKSQGSITPSPLTRSQHWSLHRLGSNEGELGIGRVKIWGSRVPAIFKSNIELLLQARSFSPAMHTSHTLHLYSLLKSSWYPQTSASQPKVDSKQLNFLNVGFLGVGSQDQRQIFRFGEILDGLSAL